MMSVAYGKYRFKIIQQLVQSLRQVHDHQSLMQDEMFQKYLEHCVQMIQKIWKGHYERNYLIGNKV